MLPSTLSFLTSFVDSYSDPGKDPADHRSSWLSVSSSPMSVSELVTEGLTMCVGNTKQSVLRPEPFAATITCILFLKI